MLNNTASKFPIKSKTLSGITDLTLIATVKRGLIDALDTRSYTSRARLVMRTLNTLRLSSREIERTPLIADLVDRVQAIHSFRVALIEQEPRQILLNVVFDGGWEPYMRRIWRDLGPLLDLIFCNCEDYPLSATSRFADYAAWVRKAQIETDFFYTAAAVTVGDLEYLRKRERERVTPPPVPAQPGAASEATAEPTPAPTTAKDLNELLGQAMPALVALYRLSDMHPPATSDIAAGDGGCLWRAARRLLGCLDGGLLDERLATPDAIARAKANCASASELGALTWFYRESVNDKTQPARETWTPSRVQAGIVEEYLNITHGCLLLIDFRDAAAGRALLDYLLENKRLLNAGEVRFSWTRPLAPHHNVAFTLPGLQLLGVPDGTLATLPQEFREGMAARAGILGDIHVNHPTHWRLPTANWPPGNGSASARPIELANVHAVVQIQAAGTASAAWAESPGDPGHPLHAVVTELATALANQGVRILAVQAMQRFTEDKKVLGALGFVDGISQPRLEPSDVKDPDVVKVGDLLLGYRNSFGDESALRGRLWDDGTFLVVRKLRQNSKAFEATANNADIKSAMMGRTPEGEVRLTLKGPLQSGNDFDFKNDKTGAACPFASHIRRANPRTLREPDLPSLPRILRRGMSWGPRDGKGDSGLVFMAYGASIAEQFEVIQGWLAGGNSSGPGLYSGDRDPLLGVPREGDPDRFEFKDTNGNSVFVPLPADRPFVKLDWGLYLFVPSMAALNELRALADEADRLETQARSREKPEVADEKQRRRRQERSVMAQKGAAAIARLRRAEQVQSPDEVRDLWKTALEDLGARMSGLSEAIWAAVIDVHGGALRTPYGVIVAAPELVRQVLCDVTNVSAEGYNERLAQSFGAIYLGMDNRPPPPNDYTRLSREVNQAIMGIGTSEAFKAAYDVTFRAVRAQVAAAQVAAAQGDKEVRVEIRDLVDAVLAEVCTQWFGIPDRTDVREGGWHWRNQATCPGHFGAPSRYTFQPNPGSRVVEVGRNHGKELFEQVRAWVGREGPSHRNKPLLAAIIKPTATLDEQARTLIGIMMGFLPTVDGNLRGALWDWVDDRSLWRLQLDLDDAVRDSQAKVDDAAQMFPLAQAILTEPLARRLHLRPVPELVWRTAVNEMSLGKAGVTVQPGERVVVGLVGALQQRLAEDDLDLALLFGGSRTGGAGPSHPPDDLAKLMVHTTGVESKPDDWSSATHACPGSRMAWGVMLGFLAGLLCAARLRPTLTPAALKLQAWPLTASTASPASAPPAPGASPSPAT